MVFLNRIVPGAADRSYGVHVAAIAGLPRAVVTRARELLRELEASSATLSLGSNPVKAVPVLQPMLLPISNPVIEELAAIEPDALTPLEALQRLYELRQDARRVLGAEG